MTSDGDKMLTYFLKYRREKLAQKHPNDNAQLITKQKFEKGVVAKALKGPICTFEYSGGLNTDYSPVMGLIATTVAHSLGHNFGMEHDVPECKCPKDQCIMSSKVHSEPPTDWSSCSVDYLKRAFSQGMDYCLKNIPKWLFDGPVCGNGFLEEGEQCDCGLPQYCNNLCCNAETCTMRSNVTCAHGQCCDIETCSLKEAGTLCRSAISECDLEEYCSGYSSICPVDYHKLDAEVCDGGNAYCYQGSCKSRTDQCKMLWGETANSSEIECYRLNTKGLRHGNCGYNKLTQSYMKCEEGNQLCGMLQCIHRNERLEFGLEPVAILSRSYIATSGNIIVCNGAIVDLGLDQIDPGLAPNGAPCGEGKMCLNQKCISVSGLRNQGPSCPRDCNGNGWCNNKGNCHCKDGFAPPYCDFPGPGGSLDSGPASDPKALWKNCLQPSSSSVITNTTKQLATTVSPVDDLAMHSDDLKGLKHFNDTVTDLNNTGKKSNTNTDLNNAARILNKTSINFDDTSVTSDTIPSKPEDTTTNLNDTPTNTPEHFNDKVTNLNDTGKKSDRNMDSNNAAGILNNPTNNFGNTGVASDTLPSQLEDTRNSLNDTTKNTPEHFNDTVTSLNDTGKKSDTNTDLNNAAGILNNTSMTIKNPSVGSDTLLSQPKDTTSSLNDTSTNTPEHLNDTVTNLNDTGTKLERNTDLNNAARILKNT